MNLRESTETDVVSYMELLEWPTSKWSQTESDGKTDELWLQLCFAILGGTSRDSLKWMRAVDPPRHHPRPDDLPVELQANAADRLTMLRVAQGYWGVGVTAGNNLEQIGIWAGDLDSDETISVLRHLTELIRGYCSVLESELFRHAGEQAERRISAWLGSIPPRDADVLIKRYGLNGQPSATLEEIGRSRGVTRARIQQIEARAFRRLGQAVKEQIQAFANGSYVDAMDSVFRSLSTRPGEDVHRVDDLLKVASLNKSWWICGISMLSKDMADSAVRTERNVVREWLITKQDAIWLGDRMHFMKRRSETKSHYINVARKLLSIHEAVPIPVVYEAITDTWRNEIWPKCMLTVDHLRAFFRDSTIRIDDDCLVRSGFEIYHNELSQSEQHLLEALQVLGGVAGLAELREHLPDLRKHGSTLSQTLYNRSPIVQHVGPSIFGIRGVAHDPDRLALLEIRAYENGHQWIDRAGWARDTKRTLQYRISPRKSLPSQIRLPNDIAEDLLDDDENHRPLVWRTPDGLDHSVGIRVTSSGTYFTGTLPVLNSLHTARGNTISIQVDPDGVWVLDLVDETPDETVVIRLGRGWTSVAF